MTGLTPGWFYERSGSILGKDVDVRPRMGRWVGRSLCQTHGGVWEKLGEPCPKVRPKDQLSSAGKEAPFARKSKTFLDSAFRRMV